MDRTPADHLRELATCEQTGICMRPIEITDADTVASWFLQIEDVSIFDRQIPVPVSLTEVTQLFTTLLTDQKSQKCKWFIAETGEGVAVGLAGLENINSLHGHAILPMFVAGPWRRSGVGIRMAAMMMDIAFRQLRLHRVATLYRADNAASSALLRRLGFVLEGTSRQAWFNNGRHFDIVNAGALEPEWRAARAVLRKKLSKRVIVKLGPYATNEWCWPAPSVNMDKSATD
jgi:RimJ/RimL family protein N-acetyltransferase